MSRLTFAEKAWEEYLYWHAPLCGANATQILSKFPHRKRGGQFVNRPPLSRFVLLLYAKRLDVRTVALDVEGEGHAREVLVSIECILAI